MYAWIKPTLDSPSSAMDDEQGDPRPARRAAIPQLAQPPGQVPELARGRGRMGGDPDNSSYRHPQSRQDPAKEDVRWWTVMPDDDRGPKHPGPQGHLRRVTLAQPGQRTHPSPSGRSARALPQADALLAAVSEGDTAAFDEFYDLVAPAVYSVALSIVRDPSRAQEVAQEVFLEAWRTASRFDPSRGSAKAWLVTMARGRAVDHVRSAQTAADRDAAAGFRNGTRDFDMVSDEVETRLAHQHVRRCLQSLTSLQREAVLLAFYRGYTHQEVAKLLAVPLGTVKARLRDGLIRLRDCVGMW